MQKRPRDFNYIDTIISEYDSIIGTAQEVTDFASASNDFNASGQKEIGIQCSCKCNVKKSMFSLILEPITNLHREGKALQIEAIDQNSEFTESESLFDYEKSKSTASSILNYLSSVILIAAVTCLGDTPNSDLAFNVFKPYNIAGKPKPSKDYQLEKGISRFEYRFGSIILVHTH